MEHLLVDVLEELYVAGSKEMGLAMAGGVASLMLKLYDLH